MSSDWASGLPRPCVESILAQAGPRWVLQCNHASTGGTCDGLSTSAWHAATAHGTSSWPRHATGACRRSPPYMATQIHTANCLRFRAPWLTGSRRAVAKAGAVCRAWAECCRDEQLWEGFHRPLLGEHM